MAESLSRDEVRRIALTAQGLAGPPPKSATAVLATVGAVQLDTISVLSRSHVLVAWARLGAVARSTVEAAYWSRDSPTAFEYWSHAACILPIERWPHFAFRRRERELKSRRLGRLSTPTKSIQEVLARLADGPLTSNSLGGAKSGSAWGDWTEPKIAIEWLLDTGEVVCVRREGWRRVYDLASRVVPGHLLDENPDDDACHRLLVEEAARGLGVATIADLAHHHHGRRGDVQRVINDTSLVRVAVEGSSEVHYAAPDVLERASKRRTSSRTTLLSPFDSLIWDRARTERIFGFIHRLEAYTPRDKRIHGYFTMPVLADGQLVGRVDPARDGTTFVARQVSFDADAMAATATAIAEAARWVGCDAVRVDQLTSSNDGPALERLANEQLASA